MRELEEGIEGLRSGVTHVVPVAKAGPIQSLKKQKRKLAPLSWEIILLKEAGIGMGPGDHGRMETFDGLALPGSSVGSRVGHELDSFSSTHISKGKSHQKGT